MNYPLCPVLGNYLDRQSLSGLSLEASFEGALGRIKRERERESAEPVIMKRLESSFYCGS